MPSSVLNLRLQAFKNYYVAFKKNAAIAEQEKWARLSFIDLSGEQRKSLYRVFQNMFVKLNRIKSLQTDNIDLQATFAIAKEKSVRQQRGKTHFSWIRFTLGSAGLIFLIILGAMAVGGGVPAFLILLAAIGIGACSAMMWASKTSTKTTTFKENIRAIENEEFDSNNAFHRCLQEQVAPSEPNSMRQIVDATTQTVTGLDVPAAPPAPVNDWTVLWTPGPRDASAASASPGFDPFQFPS